MEREAVMVAPTGRRGPVWLLERGSIFFAYRRRGGSPEVRGLGDIERMYAVMTPEAGERAAPYRVMVIGRKSPARGNAGGARYWGMVTRVADTAEKIAQELAQEEYMTRAGGRCYRIAARPCGEGAYCIALHDGHTHMAYQLEAGAAEEGRGGEVEPVRRAVGIDAAGNYLLWIKNPAWLAVRGAAAGEEQPATYPDRLQDAFGDRRFLEPETTEYLDYEGAQVLLIGAGEGGEVEPGVVLDAAEEASVAAEMAEELRRPREPVARERLFRGESV